MGQLNSLGFFVDVGLPVISTNSVANGQKKALLNLINQIRASGTPYEKDYLLPKYLEQLKCYTSDSDTTSILTCTARVGAEHDAKRAELVKESGLKFGSEFQDLYNESTYSSVNTDSSLSTDNATVGLQVSKPIKKESNTANFFTDNKNQLIIGGLALGIGLTTIYIYKKKKKNK